MEYLKTSMGSATTRKFIKELVFNDVLMAKDSSPDLSYILNSIRRYENKIRKEIKHGSYEYFKTANIKTEDAYDSPFAIGSYKAAYVWNHICPNNQIELPGVAYIVKIKADKLKDLDVLIDTHPDIYAKFEKLFDTDITMVDRTTKEKVSRKLGAGGISAIAVPLDIELPDWLIKIIDLTEIIQANTKLILPVLQSLGLYPIFNRQSSMFVGGIVDLD